ncbi:MAG: ribosomal protein S18-alanine N-acetyltransferase [Deltaproteobacteria bacterium]|nr:ribosomal protein S18-alanine N-acetyltransferase [Deltaproteobacteria bacterium]
MELRVDPMQAEDLPQVLEIERQSFPQPWTAGLFLHELKLPFSRTLLLRSCNGSPAALGYICRWLVAEEVHILNVAVHPDYRGRGFGRLLVETIIHEARTAGARLVTLEVRRHNAAALRLYRKLGFAEKGVRRNYYGRGDDAIIMTRELSAGAGGELSL